MIGALVVIALIALLVLWSMFKLGIISDNRKTTGFPGSRKEK